MKLILAIVRDSNSNSVTQGLTSAGFRVTRCRFHRRPFTARHDHLVDRSRRRTGGGGHYRSAQDLHSSRGGRPAHHPLRRPRRPVRTDLKVRRMTLP